MKFYLIIFLISFVLILSCSENPTSSNNKNYLYTHQIQFEKAAVFYSGELFPPENLSKQIDRELSRITNTWKDSVECLSNFDFATPWALGVVEVLIEDSVLQTILDSTNSDWDEMVEKYDLKIHVYFPSITREGTFAAISSKHLLHPILLAKKFVDFPGIIIAETRGSLYPILYPYFSRFVVGRDIHYYFYEIACPDIFDNYYHFIVNPDTAYFVGSHSECEESLIHFPNDSLSGDSLYVLFEYYRDSLEANHPAWVDTARTERRPFYINEHFYWDRDSI